MERNSMKKIKPSVTYETRYKHKLNMPEPGTALLKWSGLFLLLLILLVIEAHQDGVLNKIAAGEKKES